MSPRAPISRVRTGLIRTLLFFAAMISAAQAQTIRPLLSEYRNEANGSVELVNDSFVPANVVLEAKSFTVTEDGEIQYRSLDPGINLKFSSKSFRIQPKQTYVVNYKAKATTLPAYFVIYAGFSNAPLKTDSGLNVQILLPHTVYILPKKDATKHELQLISADFDQQSKKIQLEITSGSNNFARVLLTEVAGDKKRVQAAGFPVYPHKNRKVEVEWPENETPEKLVLHFRDFKLEARLNVR